MGITGKTELGAMLKIVATFIALVFVTPLQAQGVNNDWGSDGSGINPDQYQGKWEGVDHWSEGVIPGTATTTDHNPGWMGAWGNSGPGITTVDADTLTTLGVSTLNIRSIRSQSINQSSGLNRSSVLIVNGIESQPITINVGSLTDPPGDAISSSIRLRTQLTWTNLNIVGTPTGEGIWFNRQGTDLAGDPAHVFIDTNVTMTSVAANRGLSVGYTAGTVID